MINAEITYNNRNLVIQGELQPAEPNIGLRESFDIWEMKANDLDVSEDYDLDEELEIEQLCIKAAKEDNQTNIEIAKA